MKANFKLLTLLLIVSWGCSKDKEEEKLAIEDEKDRRIIEKLGMVHASTENYWPGYSLKGLPQFIRIPEPGRATHGYFIYPATPLPAGSTSMDNYQTFGLPLARGDSYTPMTAPLTDTGGGLFFPALTVNFVPYISFLHTDPTGTNPYFDYSQKDLNWLPSFTGHELFHRYQYMTWSNLDRKFDLDNYPLSRDMIAWHLLLWDLAVEAYDLSSPSDFQQFLRNYVAIRKKMRELDDSAEMLITTMAEPLERLEGSARYVEHFMEKDTFFPAVAEDPTHGWSEILAGTLTAQLLRSTYAQRMHYHVGAIVTHSLKINGVDVTMGYKTTTPFAMTEAFVNLTPVEADAIINGFTNSPTWGDYLAKADVYFAILN